MLFRRETEETVFACFRGGTWNEELRVPLGTGKVLMPYRPDNNLLSHRVVLFPSSVGSYETTEELLREVRDFIHRYVDVSADFEEIATYYVLLSWVYDVFNEIPYLRARGDFGSGKSRLLQTVGSVCYKPIFASGASTISPIFRILDSIRGTLVIDEGDFRVSDEKADIVKILNNGNARGFPILRSEATPQKEYNPRAFTVYGPKIVATRRYFDDQALESRCITEDMGLRTVRSDIPLNLPKSFLAEGEELRNKLLLYRFRTLTEEKVLSPDRSIEPRIAQVFAPLLSLVADREARQRMVLVARRYNRDLRGLRTLDLESEILRAIYSLKQDGVLLSMKAIAEQLSEEIGEAISPRRVGSILRRRLFLSPLRREGVFVIPSTEFPKLTSLFEKYRIVDSEPNDDVGDVGDES